MAIEFGPSNARSILFAVYHSDLTKPTFDDPKKSLDRRKNKTGKNGKVKDIMGAVIFDF